MTVIDLAGVRLVAGESVISRSLDLRLMPGERVAIIGPSGVGKSTLARAMVGAEPAGVTLEARRRTLTDVDLAALPDSGRRALRRERVDFVGQDPAAHLLPTVMLRHLVTADARPALAELDLGHLPGDRYAWELSGGEQRRLALALGLRSDVELVVLDEPTGGLDAQRRSAVLAWIDQKIGTSALVLLTHDREAAVALGCRMLQLDDGHLIEPAAQHDSAPFDRRPIGAPALTARDLAVAPAPAAEVIVRGDLEVCAGEIVALVGDSGAGKSTLARAICGLADLRAGSLALHGAPLHPRLRRRSVAQRRSLRWVPQDAVDALNPTIPVGVAIGRSLPRRGRAAEVQRRLAEVGLSAEDGEKTPPRLSGGQRHRAVLAKALATDPSVLVCDEITSALDDVTRERILDALVDRARSGTAVLLLTHDPAIATRCDRVLTVDPGHIIT